MNENDKDALCSPKRRNRRLIFQISSASLPDEEKLAMITTERLGLSMFALCATRGVVIALEQAITAVGEKKRYLKVEGGSKLSLSLSCSVDLAVARTNALLKPQPKSIQTFISHPTQHGNITTG